MRRSRKRCNASLRRLRAQRNAERRYIDLAVQFRIKDGPDAGTLTRCWGGRWDSFTSRYVSTWDDDNDCWVGDAPQKVHTIHIAAQSVDFIENWESKMILALGGRRSGKTTGSLAPKIIVCMLFYAGLPGEVLSPTYRQAHNVWKAVLRLTPRDWWISLHKTDHRMTLANNSQCQLLTADREDSARSEGVAWGAYDERQDIKEGAASNAVLSMSESPDDVEGLGQIFETATIKPELREHWERLTNSPDAAIYPMTTRGNPFIDGKALYELASQFLDEDTVLRELDAQWPEVVGRVYYPFDEMVHVKDVLDLRDITADICRERFDAPAAWIVGVDPPRHAVLAKVFDGEVCHVLQEVVVGADNKGGDVRDLAKRCRQLIGDARGVVIFDPHETHWDHDVAKYFRSEMFRPVYMKRVQIEYRLTAVRARLQREKLFVASSCIHLRESLRDQLYDEVTGRPAKRTPSKITPRYTLDHPPDSLGYLVYKLWPSKVDYERLEKDVRRAA